MSGSKKLLRMSESKEVFVGNIISSHCDITLLLAVGLDVFEARALVCKIHKINLRSVSMLHLG